MQEDQSRDPGPLAQCELNSENPDLGNKQNVRLSSSPLFCFSEVHSVFGINACQPQWTV